MILFQSPTQTVCELFHKTLNLLHESFIPYNRLPSASHRKYNSVKFFDKNITMLMDGTEQKVMIPKDEVQKGHFYSSKQKHHSITILLFFSPKKREVYKVAEPRPSGETEKNILRHWCSCFLQMLIKDERILSDKGFEGMQDLRILTTAQYTSLSRVLSQQRIWAECYIGDIKNFRICSDKIYIPPSKEGDILNFAKKIWTVGCGFALGYP